MHWQHIVTTTRGLFIRSWKSGNGSLIWFQLCSTDNVQSSTLSQPTAAAGGNSHLHSITYPAAAVALILLPSCKWYPYPHRRTDDKGTSSILSLGSVVGNENKSKTFSQKHSCSVDNLSCHHYLILLSTRKRHQVPPQNVSIDVKNEEL